MLNETQKISRNKTDRILRLAALSTSALALIVAAIPSVHTYFSDDMDPMTNAVNEAVERSKIETDAIVHVENKNTVTQATELAPNQVLPSFDRLEILSDPSRRISEAFLIPPGLQDRVGFWFDVYSKYDSNKRVIHHSLYPWVIYKVIDVEPIVNATYPRFRWMRNEVANTLVKKELENVRKALHSLSKKRHARDLEVDRLSGDELIVREALAQLGGDIRRTAKRAHGEVRYQTGQRDFMAEGIQKAPRYMTTMENIFRARKLPIELTRLPLVESSFNKHAESKVGAMGVWQFMESSGKMQKLVVNDVIDERKSIFKSTHAAANLLKENHMILHRSWALAITAWNHGPNGVRKAYRAAGTKDLARIIELYHSKSFNFASENFFAEFLAALYTERYSDRIFPGLPKHAPLEVHELRLTRQMKVGEILKVASISLDEFVGINPDLAKLIKLKRPLHRGLRIMVPTESRSAVEIHMTGGSRSRRIIGSNN